MDDGEVPRLLREILDELRADRDARKAAVSESLGLQRLAMRRQKIVGTGLVVLVLAMLAYLVSLRQ